MPGLVVKVHVQPGQEVAAGASLVALEAMKMENELKARGPGVVAKVLVAPGETVEKGTILVTFAS
jgi:pyruvate carboxylase subunit B